MSTIVRSPTHGARDCRAGVLATATGAAMSPVMSARVLLARLAVAQRLRLRSLAALGPAPPRSKHAGRGGAAAGHPRQAVRRRLSPRRNTYFPTPMSAWFFQNRRLFLSLVRSRGANERGRSWPEFF